MLKLAGEQAALQNDADPTRIWGKALQAAVSSQSAHLADRSTGGAPDNPQRWGWQEFAATLPPTWKPNGPCIGWVDGKDVYLDGDTAHAVALEHARRSGNPIGFGAVAIRKRLHKEGMVASVDGERLTVRMTLPGGRRGRVLHVAWDALSGEE